MTPLNNPIHRNGPVAIYELTGGADPARLEALLAIYQEQFPQYAHYAPRIRRRAPQPSAHDPRFLLHYWLVELDGQPVALRMFRTVRPRRCGLAHALAVRPAFREVEVCGRRLSEFIIFQCLSQVIADAQALGDPPAYGMVNEVDSPRLMEHYRQMGILELPAHYAEPIFPPEGAQPAAEPPALTFHPMILGFLPAPGFDSAAADPAIVADFIRAFLVDHYGLPEDHPAVQQAIQSIGEVDGSRPLMNS